MADAVRVATLPFRIVWRLVKVLFLPVAITALAWLIFGLGTSWFIGIALVCGLWALVLVNLWWIQTSGELRSLARGTVSVRRAGAGPRKRGGRR